MSLKDQLIKTILDRGYVTYGEVCQFAAEEGYKVETATRRLREVESIEPEMAKSKRGSVYIKGYRWKPFKTIENKGMSMLYKVYDPITNFNDPS